MKRCGVKRTLISLNRLNQEDVNYLESRVKNTESENTNENFKMGKIRIILTTNKKREFVNKKKLASLLNNDEEFSCNSVDRIANLPSGPRLTEKVTDNPCNTGNLANILNIKVNAPIVLTTNHRKGKYRDDGIMNGARGYVVAIQVINKSQIKWKQSG